MKLNDWDYIKKLNIETAGIYYDKQRNKEMMKAIIDSISKYLQEEKS